MGGVRTAGLCLGMLMLPTACGREPSSGTAALVEGPTPAADFSVDRAVQELNEELAGVPLEERFALRGERIGEAEAAARRASLDEGGDVTATLLAIRERMADAPEVAEEYAAAERARVDRNESFPVTEEDRANARLLDERLGIAAMLYERAATVRAARREDIERAAAHVDTPAAPATESEEAGHAE